MMRLNKFISHYTTYSRREADRAILEGLVSVDNETQTNPAIQLEDYATGVSINGKKIIPTDQYTVIVYNKAKGELVTKTDPKGRKTIYDTLDKKYRHFIAVGRLDYASEGVLLLTDASRIANLLMHSPLERVYRVKIRGAITEAMEEAMRKGLILDDASAGAHALSTITAMEFAPFYGYNIIKNRPDYSILKVSIGEGKNRELRRFFAHFGTEVADLKRLNYGGIELNNLPTGKSRFLSRKEYNDLRQFMKEEKQKEKSL